MKPLAADSPSAMEETMNSWHMPQSFSGGKLGKNMSRVIMILQSAYPTTYSSSPLDERGWTITATASSLLTA